MCARPRRVSDEQIFEALLRAMGRLHPRDLTLAEIGAEAGMTAGALVQRFGSKRGLMLAMAKRGAESGACGEIPAGGRGSRLAALEAWAEGFARLAESPEAYRRNLAYLQEDLDDPDLREMLTAQGRSNRAAVAALLRSARESGELQDSADPESLARLLEALVSGGMMSWAHYQEGKAATWIRRLVRDFLKPYRTDR